MADRLPAGLSAGRVRHGLSALPIGCLNSLRKKLGLCILRDALVLFQTEFPIKEIGSFFCRLVDE